MKKKKYVFFFIFLLALNFSVTYFLRHFLIVSNCNHLGAWGIYLDKSLILGFNFVFLLFILKLLFEAQNRLIQGSLAIIFIGGFSNFAERVFFGCVFDYLSFFGFLTYFNLSDCFIFVGVAVYLLDFFGILRKNDKNKLK